MLEIHSQNVLKKFLKTHHQNLVSFLNLNLKLNFYERIWHKLIRIPKRQISQFDYRSAKYDDSNGLYITAIQYLSFRL